MFRILLLLFLPFIVIAAPRVAVFDESGFPNTSTRDADWYVNAVDNAQKVNLKSLGLLEKFDVIIFPHGGFIPLQAEKAIGALMARGGTVIVTGEMQTPIGYDADIAAEAERIKKQDATAYIAFQKKYGTGAGGLLEYSQAAKKWISPVTGYVYTNGVFEHILPVFALKGWPNYAQSYARHYMRAYDTPVKLNPILKLNLPKEIKPKKEEYIARLIPTSFENDRAFNVFIPMYLFDKPSGRNYPSFAQAGKSKDDCATDFFIYRRNELDQPGSTLVVFGRVGLQLLESEAGEKIIREIIAYSQKKLPGELERSYIDNFHAVEKAMSNFNGAAQHIYTLLTKVAVVAHASGNNAQKKQYLNLIKRNVKEFNAINNEFMALIRSKNNGTKIAVEKLTQMINKLSNQTASYHQETLKLEKIIADSCREPSEKTILHPYQDIIFTGMDFGPWGSYGSDEKWAKVAQMGMNQPLLRAQNWREMNQLNEKFGFSSLYRLWHIGRGDSEKKRIASGVFDPRTGTVKAAKATVFDKNTPKLDAALASVLAEVNETPGISTVIHGDERDMDWSLWGEYMLEKFRQHIKEKYKTVYALNEEYDTKFRSFDEIILPLKRPETQSEHALWEDWTRYREIYRIEYEMENHVNLVKKFAPQKRQWLYGSYYRQKMHPANGINYYEYGKLVDPACLESTTRSYSEVMANDITAFNKKHVNTEWAAFYSPAGGHRENINRMRDYLWNEVNLGTIGWYLYIGGKETQRVSHSNLITPSGLVTPLGYELISIARDFKVARKLFLDGKRTEPSIRILLSPTTRRHTSWPEIEADKSLECVSGYYEAFQRLHYPARAIDEQAVIEGLLPSECKYLFVPQVDYMNRELFIKLDNFMKSGGTVIATVDSGRYDQYGHQRNYLAELAGLAINPASFPVISGERIAMYAGNTFALTPLFPDETHPLLKYDNGDIAATTSKVGAGQLVMLGFPFGREYYASFNQNERGGFAMLKALTDSIGIPIEYECADPNLIIRPWELNGEHFLNLNYHYRAQAPNDGKGFALASAPVMIDFKLKIAGNVQIEDYLLGIKLPTVFDGKFTMVKGLIENPGGKIYRIISKTNNSTTTDVSTKMIKKPIITQKNIVDSPAKTTQLKLPFKGRIYIGSEKIKIDDYFFTGDIEKGGAWSGKFFGVFEHKNQKIRLECRKGETSIFRFARKTITVKCTDVSTVMPEYIECSITEEDNKPASEYCVLLEEDFHDQASLVLSNPYLYLRILPGLGGRIIELRSTKDSPNQLVCNENAIANGISENYRDFGGLEVNPGAYQGPGWGINYKTQIVENTPERIIIRLMRSSPYEWRLGYGRWKKSGALSYEMFYSLTKSSSMLNVTVLQYNEHSITDDMVMRTHPTFRIAGDCNLEDTLYYVGKSDKTEAISYRPGRNTHYPNFGSWYAYIDGSAGIGIIQEFSKKSVGELYVWSSNNSYNTELCFNPVRTAPGKPAEFKYTIGIISGLNSISTFEDSIATELTVDGNGVYGNNQDMNFSVNIATTTTQKVKITAKIVKDQKTVHQFDELVYDVTPAAAVSKKLAWNTGTWADGEYCLETIANAKVESSIRFKLNGNANKSATINFERWQQSLELLRKQYKKSPSTELRKRIFAISSILTEWKNASPQKRLELEAKIVNLMK